MTHFLVRNGIVREGNPLMEPVVQEGSFLLLKVIGLLFSVLILWSTHKRFPEATRIATLSIVVFYGVVMAWNLNIVLNSISPF